MSLPGLIPEGIPKGTSPAEIHTLVPVLVGRLLPVLLNVLKCEELSPGVVEHSVHHHSDSCFMAQGGKLAEAVVVAQSSVYQFIIPGVIPV